MTTNKDLDRIIKDTHTNIVDVEASIPNGNGNNGSNNPNHPINWDNDRFFEYARKWIFEFAHMVEWRDNDKAGPQLQEAYPNLYKKLASFPEAFLKECLHYRVTVEQIDNWLKLSPEERYQRKKKECGSHECSVHMRYGNSYASPDKPGCTSVLDGGCIEECEYYEPTGSISDEEVLSWYSNEIGNRTYEQLKDENSVFIQEYAELLRKQANELSANFTIPEDYYPSIEDLSI